MILVDTSILVRLTDPEIAGIVRPHLLSGAVATCGLVELELLSRITEPARLVELTRLRSAAFHWLATTDDELHAAIRDQHELLESGQPAACWAARLIAAVARRHQVPVLHADPCFDRIGKLTGQDTQSVVPDGGTGRGVDRRDGCTRTL